MEYWEWWIGGLALGLFSVVFSFLTGKPLGVSGSWLSIARRKDDAILKASAEVLDGDQDQVKDDLMAMTMAEFGDDALEHISPVSPQRREGEVNAEWVLMDYVNVVVHVFQKHIREYYDIESLWGDAKTTIIETNY